MYVGVKLFRFFPFFFFAFGTLTMAAPSTVLIQDEVQDFTLGVDQISYLRDSAGNLSFAEAQSKEFTQPSPEVNYQTTPHLQEWYWVKFRVKGNPASDYRWVMEVYDLHIDSLIAFFPNAQGGYDSLITGSVFDFDQRTYRHINFVFNLPLEFQGERDFYVKLWTRKPAGMQFQIRTANFWSYYAVNEYYLLGVFYGILVIMALYNLLIFFNMKERVYIYYVLYVLAVAFNSLLEDGTGFAFIWPHSPGVADFGTMSSRYLLVATFTLYSTSFLKLKRYLPKVDKGMNIALGVYGVYYVIQQIFHFDFLNDLIYMGFFVAIYGLGIYQWVIRKYLPARYFLLSFSAVLISVTIVWLRDRGVIQSDPNNSFTVLLVYALNIGAVFEIFILSIALGDRIRFLRLDRERAQKRIIAQLQENERLKDKVNRELEAKVAERTLELKDKNKSIIDSINYAQRIQKSLLPKRSELKKVLTDYLLVYEPKDIVSGDFYWVHEHEDTIFFAALDCTGHGVPGAFMTIMGQNMLHYAITEKGQRVPANILNRMNEELQSRIVHNPEDFEEQYGMDIALCSYHRPSRKLNYAGAFMNLIIIREGQLIEIKANRFPLGHYYFVPEDPSFTNHEVEVHLGDRIFLFSDGYADQFGGDQGDKYMSDNFKQLILASSDLPLQDQEAKLKSEFFEWKGAREQIDDILVLGVEITA